MSTAVATLLYVLALAPMYAVGETPPFDTVAVHGVILLLLVTGLRGGRRGPSEPRGVDRAGAVLGGAVVFLALFFVAMAVRKWRHLGYGGEDVTYISQALYRTLRGEGVLAPLGRPSHLGTHFSPYLFLILPVYALVPHALTLIVIKVVAVATSAIPLYRLAALGLPSASALQLALAYLLSLPVVSQYLHEYYDLQFAPLLLLWTLFFLARERFLPFLTAAALLSLLREEMGMLVALVGVLAGLRGQPRRFALVPVVLGLSFSAGGYLVGIPFFSWKGAYDVALATGGAPPPASGHELVTALATRENAQYLYLLGAPFAYVLPFLDPGALLALPFIGGILLSPVVHVKSLTYHYSAFLVAALFASVVSRIARRRREGRGQAVDRTIPALLLALSSAFAYPQYLRGLPAEVSTPFKWPGSGSPRAYLEAADAALRSLPRDAEVLVPRYMGPRVPPRPLLDFYWSYGRPSSLPRLDHPPAYILIDDTSEDGFTRIWLNQAFLSSPECSSYRLLMEGEGLRLFARRGMDAVESPKRSPSGQDGRSSRKQPTSVSNSADHGPPPCT